MRACLIALTTTRRDQQLNETTTTSRHRKANAHARDPTSVCTSRRTIPAYESVESGEIRARFYLLYGRPLDDDSESNRGISQKTVCSSRQQLARVTHMRPWSHCRRRELVGKRRRSRSFSRSLAKIRERGEENEAANVTE